MSLDCVAQAIEVEFDALSSSVAKLFAKASAETAAYVKDKCKQWQKAAEQKESRYLDEIWQDLVENERDKEDSLSDLLDRLDDAFASIRMPESKHSWPMRRTDVAALKKLGPFVPDVWRSVSGDRDDSLINPNGLPSLAVAHFISSRIQEESKKNGEGKEGQGKIFPRFIFAIKHERLPEGVERYAGTPYMFGVAFCMTDEPGEDKQHERIWWVWCWVVVSKSGRVIIPNEKRDITHRVLRRRKNHDGRRQETFTTRNWYSQSLARFHDDAGKEADERTKKWLCAEFKTLIVWWRSRSKSWSVSANKLGQRMTFCIGQRRAVTYFRNRDRTALASDGKRKRILHIVREHIRSTGSVVKQHVRGIADFVWNGYECHITAPTLTGYVVSAEYDVDPVEYDETDPEIEKALDLPELADRLVAMEEVDIRHTDWSKAVERLAK